MDTNLKQYLDHDYSWIKIKRHVIDESKSWKDRYMDLKTHHIEETTFLINKVKELANLLLEKTQIPQQ